MTTPIRAQLVNGETRGCVFSYTVKAYADYIFDNAYQKDGDGNIIMDGDTPVIANQAFAKAYPLVESMLYYGACAQRPFEYNTNFLADEDIKGYSESVADVSVSVSGMKNNVPVQTIGSGDNAVTLTYYASSLVLRSKTVYKLYFTSNTADTALLPSLTNGTGDYAPISQTYEGQSYICYEITDIAPQFIDADITLRFGTNSEFTVNIGEYANLTFSAADATKAERDTINALYNYSASA